MLHPTRAIMYKINIHFKEHVVFIKRIESGIFSTQFWESTYVQCLDGVPIRGVYFYGAPFCTPAPCVDKMSTQRLGTQRSWTCWLVKLAPIGLSFCRKGFKIHSKLLSRGIWKRCFLEQERHVDGIGLPGGQRSENGKWSIPAWTASQTRLQWMHRV